MPLDDELDRQSFYRGEAPDATDEDEYELEPPDEEIIAGEKRRAAAAVEEASMAVDVDALYRENTSVTMDEIESHLREMQFKFQFGVKHLLIAMTVVALAFIVGRFLLGGFLPLLIVLTFTVLASAYGFILWKENERRKEWEAKRDELYRRNKERHQANQEED